MEEKISINYHRNIEFNIREVEEYAKDRDVNADDLINILKEVVTEEIDNFIENMMRIDYGFLYTAYDFIK